MSFQDFGIVALFFLIAALVMIVKLQSRAIDNLNKRVNGLEQDGWQ